MSKSTNKYEIPSQRIIGGWLETDPPADLDEAKEIGSFVGYALRREAEKAAEKKDNDFSHLFVLDAELRELTEKLQ
jgi:hypothetical protein